jgi:histidine phosphotransferase ChpT
MDDMMPRERQSLADLIGSRLCHDLSNPLGAIGNGVELLDLTGAAQGPEMDLIRDAVAMRWRGCGSSASPSAMPGPST